MRVVQQLVDDLTRPVLHIRHLTEIGEWLLGTAWPALDDAQSIRHVDQELAVTSPLAEGQSQDATEVALAFGVLLLREVADDVIAIFFNFAKHVEEEYCDVVDQVLVLEEHARNVGQILAVGLLCRTVHFEESNLVYARCALAVDLIARWGAHCALLCVPSKFLFTDAEMEAKVADVQTLDVKFVRKRSEVPDLLIVAAELDGVDGLKLCDVKEMLDVFFFHTKVLVIKHVLLEILVILSVFTSIFFILLFCIDNLLLANNLARVNLDHVLGNPPVEAAIITKIVNIVFVAKHFAQVRNKFLATILRGLHWLVAFLGIFRFLLQSNLDCLFIIDKALLFQSFDKNVEIRFCEVLGLLEVAVRGANRGVPMLGLFDLVDLGELPSFAISHQSEDLRVHFVSARILWNVDVLSRGHVRLFVSV